MRIRSISRSFVETVHANPLFNVLGYKEANSWNNLNRSKLYDMTTSCVDILKYYNIGKEDRVAFKGKNAKENLAWNMATNSMGAIWVPMYSDQTIDYCKYIIGDCQPKILISDNEIDKSNFPDTMVINKDIEISNSNKEINFVDNEISTLIYTSGTTGNPKGVTLTNENILSNIDSIVDRFRDINNVKSLNILPWAHIYSLTCELYYNLLHDNQTFICSNKDNFIKECSEVSPNVLYLVPKVLEAIKTKLEIMDKPVIRIILPIILRRLLGNNIMTIFMGGAKLDANTRKFYLENGVNICEGYGCSETAPMVSVNHMSEPRDEDSVGMLMNNIEVDILDNEIYVSGPNIMKGYWNQPEASEEVLKERNNKIWYKTGDLGYVSNNYLYYQGRKSDNYKLSNGKFVNVLSVENKIKQYLKGNFIIHGDNMEYNIIITDQKIEDSTLNLINSQLESYLHIKDTYVIDTDKMSGFLTPKMSIKRKALIAYYNKHN